ncbi:MAG: peptide/nickel transport system permease protein [Thermomicrobiales bacterium]|nr:peptide/nickel transport system permease protein [Thermomicrobiales bacterium]
MATTLEHVEQTGLLDATARLRRPRRTLVARMLAGAVTWKTFTLGLLLIGVFLLCVVFAPVVAPYDPAKPNFKALLQQPSGDHLFGTDDKGRDIFSRVVYGTRVSFKIAVVSVGLATLVGLPLGLFAGFYGGWIDATISRLVDAFFAFPPILMAIAILAIKGPGEQSAIIAIGLIAIPEFARVSRSAMIAEKENEYVLAARSIGASVPRIIFRGILPNTLGPVVVLISLGFAFAILNETALSFLGLGAQPPTPSWGADLAQARRYIRDAPWLSIFPGLAIFFLVLALNLTGDGLRDLMDPRRNRR